MMPGYKSFIVTAGILALLILLSGVDNIVTHLVFRPNVKVQPPPISQYYTHKNEYFVSVGKDSLHLMEYTVANPIGTILYAHGNKSDLKRWGPIASEFTKSGYNVMVWDYRGYGKSSGKPDIDLLLSDVEKVYDFVTPFVRNENLVLYGRSLGTGVISFLADKPEVDKIILESPYPSLADIMYSQVGPIARLSKLDIPALTFAESAKKPFLILQGTIDKVIPLPLARKYFNGLKSNHKKWVEIPEGNHNNLHQFPIYWKAIDTFLHDNKQ
jgi:alpha-beta hydrolase superfamily lysophospholipase